MDKPLTFELSKDKKTLNTIQINSIPFGATIYDKCEYCHGSSVMPSIYSYKWENRLETVMVRCLNTNCFHHMWLTIHSLTSDGGLYANNNTQIHTEVSYDKVFEEIKCIKCKAEYKNLSGDISEILEKIKLGLFASRVLQCPNCGDYKNLIHFHPPLYFSKTLLNLADETNHPHAKVVLIVSAIEIYFKKIQNCINKLSGNEIEKRPIQNFQHSNEIKKFIKEELGYSIEQLARQGKTSATENSIRLEVSTLRTVTVSTKFDWETLTKYIRIRHQIVHQAGYDDSFMKISMSRDEAEAFYINAKNFIQCANTEFIKRLYPF